MRKSKEARNVSFYLAKFPHMKGFLRLAGKAVRFYQQHYKHHQYYHSVLILIDLSFVAGTGSDKRLEKHQL